MPFAVSEFAAVLQQINNSVDHATLQFFPLRADARSMAPPGVWARSIYELLWYENLI